MASIGKTHSNLSKQWCFQTRTSERSTNTSTVGCNFNSWSHYFFNLANLNILMLSSNCSKLPLEALLTSLTHVPGALQQDDHNEFSLRPREVVQDAHRMDDGNHMYHTLSYFIAAGESD
ncbi:hypothetical protein V6Z11_D04G028800 [Gossypium hirsutum]